MWYLYPIQFIWVYMDGNQVWHIDKLGFCIHTDGCQEVTWKRLPSLVALPLQERIFLLLKDSEKFLKFKKTQWANCPLLFIASHVVHLGIQGKDYNVAFVLIFSAHTQVCTKCVLKQSCKFVNQSVWKGDTKNLNLAVVMRVITLYALESVPPELAVPNEIKVSVSKLLKEVLKLSQSISWKHTGILSGPACCSR